LLPLYCGDDKKFLESLEVGAKGIISVTSNIIPDKIIDNYLDFQYFYKFSDNLDEINNALFSDVNPIPLKYAVRLLYGEGYGLRLPLTETDYITQKQIETALINIGAL
jgi:4-hydroxy-tetrahydrodipicolinate synthase